MYGTKKTLQLSAQQIAQQSNTNDVAYQRTASVSHNQTTQNTHLFRGQRCRINIDTFDFRSARLMVHTLKRFRPEHL